MIIRVTPDPQDAKRKCTPAARIRQLLNAGALPRFLELCQLENDPGDCHEVYLALMTDLAHARAAHGWRWCEGTVVPFGQHSWMERSGWVLDCANALTRGLIFMEHQAYRRLYQARSVVSRDAKATRCWLLRTAQERSAASR